MIRYYLDTHIPKAVAEQLRLRGIDVVRCEEVGLAEADDTEHLEYAAAQERTLVSHDADFRTVHSVGGKVWRTRALLSSTDAFRAILAGWCGSYSSITS